MGGDYGPRVTVPALAAVLRRHAQVSALLFGYGEELDSQLDSLNNDPILQRITRRDCSCLVENHEKPSAALRKKRESSMSQAVLAVAGGDADCAVSAGNTGALMAFGLLHLRTLPGIDRPAICTAIPTTQGRTYMLDLGANLECSAVHLQQFALLGTLLAREIDGIASPTVRLLNIGEEENKGHRYLADAAALMAADDALNYRGYVEGDGIFQGVADVIVCDGFAGNVALKTSEGLAKMVSQMFRDTFAHSWMARLAALMMIGPIRRLRARLDPALYNGAHLLGLNGVVIKSHGSANQSAFESALEVALQAAHHQLPKKILPLLAKDRQPATDP